MSSTNSSTQVTNTSIVLCRCCGQPMRLELQERLGGKPPLEMITCDNEQCGMFGYTLTTLDYDTLDLEAKYGVKVLAMDEIDFPIESEETAELLDLYPDALMTVMYKYVVIGYGVTYVQAAVLSECQHAGRTMYLIAAPEFKSGKFVYAADTAAVVWTPEVMR